MDKACRTVSADTDCLMFTTRRAKDLNKKDMVRTLEAGGVNASPCWHCPVALVEFCGRLVTCQEL